MKREDGLYDCYSSSPRDGGVRCKTMALPADKWKLMRISGTYAASVHNHYDLYQGCPYDYKGALGFFFGLNATKNKKWFCSEFVASCLNINEPWRFTPNNLAVVVYEFIRAQGTH